MRASARARSSTARRPWRARRRPRGVSGACAPPTSSGTAASAACVGVEQRDRGDVVDQRAVGVVADLAITGTRSSATVRQSVSSQNAKRSASEPPPRATMITSTSSIAARSCSARGDARRGVAVLHRRERPDEPPAPAAAPQPGEDVVARLAALAGDDPDRARQGGERQRLLRHEQALGVQPPAQRPSWASRSPSPATRRPRDLEREAGRGRAAAGVVVGAAATTTWAPSASAPSGSPSASSVAPDRALRRAVAVAQFEVALRPARPQVHDLAEQLHARALAQELSGSPWPTTPTGNGPGQRAAVETLGALGGGVGHAVTPAGGRQRAVGSFTDASGLSPGSARWPRCSPSKPRRRRAAPSPARRARERDGRAGRPAISRAIRLRSCSAKCGVDAPHSSRTSSTLTCGAPLRLGFSASLMASWLGPGNLEQAVDRGLCRDAHRLRVADDPSVIVNAAHRVTGVARLHIEQIVRDRPRQRPTGRGQQQRPVRPARGQRRAAPASPGRLGRRTRSRGPGRRRPSRRSRPGSARTRSRCSGASAAAIRVTVPSCASWASTAEETALRARARRCAGRPGRGCRARRRRQRVARREEHGVARLRGVGRAAARTRAGRRRRPSPRRWAGPRHASGSRRYFARACRGPRRKRGDAQAAGAGRAPSRIAWALFARGEPADVAASSAALVTSGSSPPSV